MVCPKAFFHTDQLYNYISLPEATSGIPVGDWITSESHARDMIQMIQKFIRENEVDEEQPLEVSRTNHERTVEVDTQEEEMMIV